MPGEIKREVELGSQSWMDCLAAELFLNGCFSDAVFVTLFRTAVETAISEVHQLLRTGGVSIFLSIVVMAMAGGSLRSLWVGALGRAIDLFQIPPFPRPE